MAPQHAPSTSRKPGLSQQWPADVSSPFGQSLVVAHLLPLYGAVQMHFCLLSAESVRHCPRPVHVLLKQKRQFVRHGSLSTGTRTLAPRHSLRDTVPRTELRHVHDRVRWPLQAKTHGCHAVGTAVNVSHGPALHTRLDSTPWQFDEGTDRPSEMRLHVTLRVVVPPPHRALHAAQLPMVATKFDAHASEGQVPDRASWVSPTQAAAVMSTLPEDETHVALRYRLELPPPHPHESCRHDEYVHRYASHPPAAAAAVEASQEREPSGFALPAPVHTESATTLPLASVHATPRVWVTAVTGHGPPPPHRPLQACRRHPGALHGLAKHAWVATGLGGTGHWPVHSVSLTVLPVDTFMQRTVRLCEPQSQAGTHELHGVVSHASAWRTEKNGPRRVMEPVAGTTIVVAAFTDTETFSCVW